MTEKIKGRLVLEIESAIKDIVNGNDLKIVDIDIKGGTNKAITVFLYGKDAVDTQKLESISRILYPVIEAVPYFRSGFSLELSTPGIFRNIKYFEEFNIFAGRKIKIISGEGIVSYGTLEGYGDNEVKISLDGQIKSFKVFEIKKAMLNG